MYIIAHAYYMHIQIELNKQLASSNLNTNENYPATSKSYMNTYSTEQ